MSGKTHPGASAGGERAAALREAERLYERLLPGRTGDPFALHALGLLAQEAGRSDIAADLIARAIAHDGRVPDFHYNLAIALKAQGRLAEAAEAYGRAIALKPDYAQAHNNLGNVLKAQGRMEDAAACFRRALALAPDFAQAHYNLADLLCARGDIDAAATHFQACFAHDPADALGARLMLARLGRMAAPERASAAQMERLYAGRASSWEKEAHYRGHHLVAEAFGALAPGRGLAILDAGCGTGLVGALVRGWAATLEGVDISAAMLARARAKGLYDGLHQGDLVAFLKSAPARYDAVLSAATLIHFGDLAPVFRAAAIALKPAGLFVFTLFPLDGRGDFAAAPHPELAKGGCYAHGGDYVRRLAAQSGFALVRLARDEHERDGDGLPVAGLLVALRRLAD